MKFLKLSSQQIWDKKTFIGLAAARIAHYFSPGSEYQSNVQAVSYAANDSSTDRSSEDTDSDDDVALAGRNLGNLDDLATHLKDFIGELTGNGQRHMTFCMILWIIFLKDSRYKSPHDKDIERWLRKTCEDRQIREEEMAKQIHWRVEQKVESHPLLGLVKETIKRSQKKQYVASIAIIDHMVLDLLKNTPDDLMRWQKDVVKSWYSTSDETAHGFLVRANEFLGVSVGGAHLLLAGFKIQSYVAFMQMSRLAACLLFGYLETCKFEFAPSASAAGGGGGDGKLLHGFCTFVSSTGQVFSLTDADMPAQSALTTIVQGLQCLAHLQASEWETLGHVKTTRELLLENHHVELHSGSVEKSPVSSALKSAAIIHLSTAVASVPVLSKDRVPASQSWDPSRDSITLAKRADLDHFWAAPRCEVKVEMPLPGGEGGQGKGKGASNRSADADADAALLFGPPHTEHPASAGENGAFGSQHLACVLSAVFDTLKNMKKLVEKAKTKNDVFKACTTTRKLDGSYNKVQLAESIAKCRPDGVTTAHELLSWLMVSAAK